jgi:hypothetical protein
MMAYRSLAPPPRTAAVVSRRTHTNAPACRRRSLVVRASLVDSAVTMAEASITMAALQLVSNAGCGGVRDAASRAHACSPPTRRRRAAPSAPVGAKR